MGRKTRDRTCFGEHLTSGYVRQKVKKNRTAFLSSTFRRGGEGLKHTLSVAEGDWAYSSCMSSILGRPIIPPCSIQANLIFQKKARPSVNTKLNIGNF